jgi:hypothetical protein
MDAWVAVAVVLYLAYALSFIANHKGGNVEGFRALTLFPFVVPVMLFWWVVGKAHWYRSPQANGFTVGIREKK